MHGTHRYAHRPVAPPSPHTRTHLSGRGCISGVKCREEYQRREAVKTHLCLDFPHGGFILPHRPPANQRYGTKIKPRRLIPANVPRTTAACWAAGRREFMPRTRRERPAADALVFLRTVQRTKITRLHCKHALVSTQTFGSTCMGSRLKIHQNNNSRNGNVEWLPERVFKIKPPLPS